MRLIDKILILLALLGLAEALFSTLLEGWDFLRDAARRPPPSWQAPAPGPRPAAPEPVPRRLQADLVPLPAASSHDPVVSVSAADPRKPNQRSTGTAVAVGRDGAWLTARHVVEGCARIQIRRGNSWDPAAVEFSDSAADVAVLRAHGGGPLLAVSEGPLGLGEAGYAFGFSGQGGPSAIYATLLGRARAVQAGRIAHNTPVTAWAERDISPPGERWIGGMSGGPLVTPDGVVIGVMSVASFRRGRIYTVAPEVVGRAVRATGLPFEPNGAAPVAVNPNNFDQARAALMNRRTVVQVLCTA